MLSVAVADVAVEGDFQRERLKVGTSPSSRIRRARSDEPASSSSGPMRAPAPPSPRSATASKYLVIDGYSLVNTRVGFRWSDGWSLSVWSRNLLDKDYFELLSAAPGGSGLYVGLPGDPRTVGVTLRMALRSRP